MADHEDYLEYLREQLSKFGKIETKKMFGGVGFFRQGLMFGMLASGVFRLKVDEQNQLDYEARGFQPYFSKTKKKAMPYWEVPADILEDSALLADWAHKSYAAAQRAGKRKG